MKTYQKIYRYQNGKCFYCGDIMQLNEMEKEHVFPKSKGGRGIKNKVLSCHFCNNVKSNLIVEDFILKIKDLIIFDINNKCKYENILLTLEKLENGMEIRKEMHKNARYKTNNVNKKPIL